MKLLTKALLDRFAKVGRQEAKGEDAVVIAKFFHPLSNWTWYATEYDPQERLFFGIVRGFETEWGYFSLDDLEQLVMKGLRMERDLYFGEHTAREVLAKQL